MYHLKLNKNKIEMINIKITNKKITCPRGDSNTRPPNYELIALPTELLGQYRNYTKKYIKLLRKKLNLL